MWFYNDKRFTEDDIEQYTGFVYLIENLNTKMMYVGKKLFTKAKRYQKNNKKRTKRVGSDWEEYVGSNHVLKEDAANGAPLNKTILYLCTSRGWMSYYETLEILQRQALTDDKYYNQYCSCKIHSKHLKC